MSDTKSKNAKLQGFRPELFAAKAKAASGDKALPPVDLWNPDFCGNIDMHIKRDGSWFYMGTLIARKRMVKLFSTILRRDEDDKFYLVTPVEKVGILVDDAPFVVVEMEMDGDEILFKTNVGDIVRVGDDHPLWVNINEKTGEPAPYIRVRGRLDALINRSVYYQLADMAVENPEKSGNFGIFSGDHFYRLDG